MKHLVLADYGWAVGATGGRLSVKIRGEEIREFPLSRLHSVTIAKRGISLSSDLVQECAARGIRIFFLNALGECSAALAGVRSHGVGLTRRHQILFLEKPPEASHLAARVTYGKIRNQRAVLCYFAKSTAARAGGLAEILLQAAESMKSAAAHVAEIGQSGRDDRDALLGVEGAAAAVYWKAWVDSGLFPPEFHARTGRGAKDATNAALNYGYAILMSRVWNAVLVAGLEPYLGFYHADRPGKPSLVLDLMEEYRAWCVDRSVVKMRSMLQGDSLSPPVKKRIVEEVCSAFEAQVPCRGRRLSLESVLQRQVYRLAGHFAGTKIYKPYLFKW